MSGPSPSSVAPRRRKQNLGGPQSREKGAGASWASRWMGRGPADWGPEESPGESAAQPGAFRPPAPRGEQKPSPQGWGPPPRSSSSAMSWDWPRPQRSRDSTPREASWEREEEGGSFCQPLRPWSPEPGSGRSRPESMAGGRWSPSSGRGARDSPEELRGQRGPNEDTRAWGSRGWEASWKRTRIAERPAWEQTRESLNEARRKRGFTEWKGEDSQRLRKEDRGWGRDARQEHQGCSSSWNQSSREQAVGNSNGIGGRRGRTQKRGREQLSPTGRQSSWGSPKREARQECWESTGHYARVQRQVNSDEAGSRWREGDYQNLSRDEGGWDSLKREGSQEGISDGAARYGGGDSLGEVRAEGDSPERGDEEKGMYSAGSSGAVMNASHTPSEGGGSFGQPLAAPAVSDSSSAPKKWTPCESVLYWWMRCRTPLQNRVREQLTAICPRPTLPDKMSETPQINPGILSLLNNRQKKELQNATRISSMLQDVVLDMLAPAMTIYEMAEEAMEKGEPVDPMELCEWARHLIRYIGSINQSLTVQRRYQVLSTINPRLKLVMSKLKGQSTDGMLFAEDKEKLLKEIIMRFPQLTAASNKMPRRGFQRVARGARYRQPRKRPFLGFCSKPLSSGSESHERGTVDQRVEQMHHQGAGAEGPAEWC